MKLARNFAVGLAFVGALAGCGGQVGAPVTGESNVDAEVMAPAVWGCVGYGQGDPGATRYYGTDGFPITGVTSWSGGATVASPAYRKCENDANPIDADELVYFTGPQATDPKYRSQWRVFYNGPVLLCQEAVRSNTMYMDYLKLSNGTKVLRLRMSGYCLNEGSKVRLYRR